jgi:integrase
MPTVTLSPALVDRLVRGHAGPRTVYFDDHKAAPQGFALRVSKTAATFYLLATIPTTKERPWVKIAPASGSALKGARLAAMKTAGEIAQGLNPNEVARQAQARKLEAKRLQARDDAEVTVAELVSRYIEARADHMSPVTIHDYKRMVRADLSGKFGSMKARAVVRNDVRTFLDAKAKGNSKVKGAPRMADTILAILNAAWKWARSEEIEPGVTLVDPARDPLFGLTPRVGTVKRTGHLEDDQIAPFWKGLDALRPVWAAIARIILLCGTRRGETYSMRWQDVDLDNAVWHIPAADRKGKVGKRLALDVPLSPLAVKIIRDLKPISGKRDRVFVAQGLCVSDIGGEVQRVTGLEVSIHDLRRSTSYGLERLGAPPHVISMVLGHARTEGATPTDAHYIGSRRPDEVRLWLTRWSDHVERLLGKRESGKMLDFPQGA